MNVIEIVCAIIGHSWKRIRYTKAKFDNFGFWRCRRCGYRL